MTWNWNSLPLKTPSPPNSPTLAGRSGNRRGRPGQGHDGRRGGYQGVFFDFFDTLCAIDPERYLEGQHQVARLLDLSFGAFFDLWVRAGIPCQVGDLPTERDRFRYVFEHMGRTVSPGILDRAVAKYQDILLGATSLQADVDEVLQGLSRRRKLPLGLISNASSSALLLFQNLRLRRFFQTVVFSFQVGIVKPDPEIYRLACRRQGLDPARCLFVGDGGAGELDGARAVGMTAVKIRRENLLQAFRRGESVSWDHEFLDLREILGFLDQPPV